MRFRRGLGAPIAALSPAVSSYDADAAAYFARMSTQEPDAFKTAVNAYIVGLKADGLWSLIDRLGVSAVTTEANALYCLRQASKVFARIGSTTFTSTKGINLVDATGGWTLNENPDAAGNAYTELSGSFAVYCNLTDNVGASRVPHFGGVAASRTSYYAHAAGSENARINQTSDSTNVRTSVTRLGLRAGSRTGGTTTRYYFNGAFTTAHTTASAPPNATHATVGRDGANFTNDRFAVQMTGQGMSDGQQAAFNTRTVTLLTALGAN